MTRIQGLDAFRRKLRRLPPAAAKKIDAALLKGVREMASAARMFVPVDTGRLAASIGYGLGEAPASKATQAFRVASKSTTGLAASFWAGDDEAFYARFVEFGTAAGEAGTTVTSRSGRRRKVYRTHPGTAAQPFFLPAYRLHRKRAQRRIARAVNDAIKQVARS